MTLLLVGAIVWYTGPYVGEPLRCGNTGGGSGLYDDSYIGLAIDIDAYPAWRCGDLIRVTVGDDVLLLPLLDSGPLSRYFIDTEDGLVPIVGDLPQHAFPWLGLSVIGMVENVTLGLRQRMERER